jgi:predicted ATP-grasp superfamily ATP-dependent carboligase
MKALVVSRNEELAIEVMKALALAGIGVYVIAPESFFALRCSRYCRGFSRLSKLKSDEDFIELINERLLKWKIDVLVPSDIWSVFLFARSGNVFQAPAIFPVAAVETLEKLHDKRSFCELLRDLGISHPRTSQLRSAADAPAVTMPFPVIVKPVSGEGGCGVLKMNSASELGLYLKSRGSKTLFPLVVQEFIDSSDAGISILAQNGNVVAWTIQRWIGRARLEFVKHKEILEVTKKIVRETSFSGVAHFDILIENKTGEMYVLECNPRFWGSLHVSVWSGVNFAALGCRLAAQRALEGKTSLESGIFVIPRQVCQELCSSPKERSELLKPSIRYFLWNLRDPLTSLGVVFSRFLRKLAPVR